MGRRKKLQQQAAGSIRRSRSHGDKGLHHGRRRGSPHQRHQAAYQLGQAISLRLLAPLPSPLPLTTPPPQDTKGAGRDKPGPAVQLLGRPQGGQHYDWVSTMSARPTRPTKVGVFLDISFPPDYPSSPPRWSSARVSTTATSTARRHLPRYPQGQLESRPHHLPGPTVHLLPPHPPQPP